MMSRREAIPCFSQAMNCSPDGFVADDRGVGAGAGDGREVAAVAGVGVWKNSSASWPTPADSPKPTIASKSSMTSGMGWAAGGETMVVPSPSQIGGS
jgi:hypothetical protein